MAIHTARVMEHRENSFESSGRAGIIAREFLMNQLCSGSRGNPWDQRG
ncbi:MAG: hypothetical protein WB992_14550 [Bryobacteraceae bacterium]